MTLVVNHKVSKNGHNTLWFVMAEVVLVMTCFLMLAGTVRAEWIEPSLTPPDTQGTLYAPVTTGPENQAKEGYLELWPGYELTQSTSLTFDPQKPLDVRGSGAKFSVPYVYDDILTVDNGTLFAHGAHGWVGIGTTVGSDNVKLNVDGTTATSAAVQVGSEANPIDGRAVSGYSSNGAGITGASAGTGIYGLRTAADGSAVLGTSISANGIKGVSTSGKGIEAVNESQTQAAVYARNDGSGWAGYFKGFLGSNSDVVGQRFLPVGLNTSLIPFTSGQEVATYMFGAWSSTPSTAMLAMDGTYVWAGTTGPDDLRANMYKIRASDGKIVNWFTRDIDFTWGKYAAVYDGRYVWTVNAPDGIQRLDPNTNQIVNTAIGGNVSSTVHKIAVSSVGGTTYIWVPDELNNAVIRVKQDDLSYQSFSLAGYPGVGSPTGVDFDGTYVWVNAATGYLVRLWPANPTDPAHQIPAFDTITANYNCIPYSVFFDGAYTWCLSGFSTNTLLRIWASDPNDPRHPPQQYGPSTGELKSMVSDGTYLWATDFSQSRLYRYLLADPNQKTYFQLSYRPERIVTDGTYVYIPENSNPPRIHKYYTGSGRGLTDLNTVVNIDQRYGFCGGSGQNECRSDADCPTGTTCPVQFATDQQQTGHINISGNTQLTNGHCYYAALTRHKYSESCTQNSDCTSSAGGTCVGANLTVGGDVDVPANQWGGTSETINVSSGQATCATNGQFVTGVTLDASSVVTSITCQGL